MKELPPSWEWTTMGDITEVVGGGTPSTADPTNFAVHGVPWLTPADMSTLTGKLVFSGARFLSDKGLKNSSAKLLPPGTVLYTSRAPIGYLGIAANPLATNQGFRSFIPEQGILSEFLYYYLAHAHDLIVSLASGTTFLELSGRRATGIPVPVPPTPEQRRIVAGIEKELTNLDAALHSLQRAKTNLKRCRSAATDSAFALYSSAPMRRLGDLGEIVGGVTKGQRRKAGIQTRSVPYLRVANVQRGHLNLDQIKHIEATEDEIRSLQLVPGDVLLNEGGDRDKLGRGWIWEGQISECIHQNHVFRVRLNPSLAVPKFVSHYANHFGQKYFFAEGKQTTNLASINMTKLRALPIPLPPVTEQEGLVAALEDQLSLIDDLDHSVAASLRRATSLRQAILKKAFEGKLVPQDPNDEPASVLLERIRAALAPAPIFRTPRKREVHT